MVKGFAFKLAKLKRQVLSADCFAHDLRTKWAKVLASPEVAGQRSQDSCAGSFSQDGIQNETVTLPPTSTSSNLFSIPVIGVSICL